MRSDSALPQTSFIKYHRRLVCQKPQPFPINSQNFTNMLSLLCQSQRLWPNSTCHMTLKCHNHWDVFWSLRCPGSKDRREDDGRVIVSLSSRSPWLAHARPNYRSWCWWRVTLRVPAICYQEPPKTGSNLGFAVALSPFASVGKRSPRP